VDAATEVDLRGQRADEARLAVQHAIDAAVVAGLGWLRIIHGKGTGVLRSVVAETVAADRRVTGQSTAPPHEGGTGVTIVELA
jgi:DNA mismatch repair protein MutS2